jgi:sugar O-acyltransferase (sialic acid O-acetyltransferase NeuD family)
MPNLGAILVLHPPHLLGEFRSQSSARVGATSVHASGSIFPPCVIGFRVCYRRCVRLPLAVWGAGGHARVVTDIVRCGSEFEVVGFLDDVNPGRRAQRFCDAPVLGGREQLDELKKSGIRHLILAFGDNHARRSLGHELVEAGFVLGRAFHPSAVIAKDTSILDGTVLMAGAVVNPGATIGKNAIINTGATVDHDCVLGEAVHLSPGVHLGGGVTVGDETWIGIGAVVLDGRTVRERSIVGAGAVVTHDLPHDVVAYGVPARVIRAR